MLKSNKGKGPTAVGYGRKSATVECIAGKRNEWTFQVNVNRNPCATGSVLGIERGYQRKPETDTETEMNRQQATDVRFGANGKEKGWLKVEGISASEKY